MDENDITDWSLGELENAATALAREFQGVTSGYVGHWWLVTSVINTSERPLSYSNVRSVFSPEERLSQTLGTIHSIRSRFSEPIVVAEMSDFEGWEPHLQGIDEIALVSVPKATPISHAAESPHKGLAEALVMAAACTGVADRSGFWKLSGRYQLLPSWPQDLVLGVGLMGNYGEEVLNTTCLGIGRDVAPDMASWLFQNLPQLIAGASIESVLTSFARLNRCENKVRLPVGGRVAVNGEEVKF